MRPIAGRQRGIRGNAAFCEAGSRDARNDVNDFSTWSRIGAGADNIHGRLAEFAGDIPQDVQFEAPGGGHFLGVEAGEQNELVWHG